MAKILSNSGITTNDTIRAGHVTQSVDALTGTDAYDITISGSLVITGSLAATDLLDSGPLGPSNVTLYDTTTGLFSYTSSAAIGGGGGGSSTLSEVVANGNTLSDGQTIQALNGGGQLNLREFDTNGTVVLNTHPGTFDAITQTGGFLALESGSSNTFLLGVSNPSTNENVVVRAFPFTYDLGLYSTGYVLISGSNGIQLNSSVTASSDISSSGDIIGTGFYTPSARFWDGSTNNTTIQRSDGGNLDTIQIKSAITNTQNIDASGNITASGDIISSGEVFGDIINADALIKLGGDSIRMAYNPPTSNLRVYGGNGVEIGNLGNVVLSGTGNITASGDISSSGDIIGNTLNLISPTAATGLKFSYATSNLSLARADGNGFNNFNVKSTLVDLDSNLEVGGNTLLNGNVTASSLPTTEPTTTGSMWISGSSVAHPNSGYLMIFNP